MEILETSCGTHIAAVGSTLYELQNVDDLIERDMDLVNMEDDECQTLDTPDTAECYRYARSIQSNIPCFRWPLAMQRVCLRLKTPKKMVVMVGRCADRQNV